MNQLTSLLPKIFAVEIPEGAKNFTIIESHDYFPSPRIEHSVGGVDLPKDGSYSILFSTKDAGEKEWETIVQEVLGWFKDYMALENGYEHDLSPTESGLSLLRSKALDTNKNYLIIKKD